MDLGSIAGSSDRKIQSKAITNDTCIVDLVAKKNLHYMGIFHHYLIPECYSAGHSGSSCDDGPVGTGTYANTRARCPIQLMSSIGNVVRFREIPNKLDVAQG